MKTNKNFLQVQGKVIKILRNKTFRVECNNGVIVTATVAARFRNARGGRRAKMVEGDRVLIEMPLGDLEKGQIVALVMNNN